jgi:hypothetical protein
MSTNTNHADDRLPTSGPDTETYDQYRSVTTDTGDVMIYHEDIGAAWLKSSFVVSLDEWL